MLIACAVAAVAFADIDRITAPGGVEPDSHSQYPAMSADGRVVAFQSAATNLVEEAVFDGFDVFAIDRATGEISLISVSHDGGPADAESRRPDISADGRYVVFESAATNLVEGDDNGVVDIFLRDLLLGVTTRVNVSSAGAPTTIGNSELARISADASHIAFRCADPCIVQGDVNGFAWDVYVRDLAAGTTEIVSVTPAGFSGDGESHWPAMSADGRFITFRSAATNLVDGDVNGAADVFIRDLAGGTTDIVSLADDGAQGNWHSHLSSVSDDGRYVAFDSQASNLIDNDVNGFTIDVFLRDRLAQTTTLISVNLDGVSATGWSQRASIAADGTFVVFESDAADLVSGDVNAQRDIFKHQEGQVTLVSTSGPISDGFSMMADVAADGRSVALTSDAANLDPPDANGFYDIHVIGVACIADANGDGELDVLDLVAYQQRWLNMSPEADCDDDGDFDVLDFICFQLAFQQGCG